MLSCGHEYRPEHPSPSLDRVQPHMESLQDSTHSSEESDRDERRDEATRLLALMVKGELSALGALYDLLGALVYSLASRILSDSREAEEVTQDVFLSVWQKASSYDASRASPLTWVSNIYLREASARLDSESGSMRS